MKKSVDTGLEYSRLTEWILENDIHKQEVIDVIHRRHIPENGCLDRSYAEAWLNGVFLLPTSTKGPPRIFVGGEVWQDEGCQMI